MISINKNKRFINFIRKKVGKAIHQHSLIEKGDRVLLGISGGIDSLSMLEIIANRRLSMPFGFELQAMHVIIEDAPENANLEYIREFCHSVNVPLHIEKISAGFNSGSDKSPCFKCAWRRRKAVFHKAVTEGYNKVAFAHHMDDALETLLMNMTYHGEFSSLPPVLQLKKGNFSLIRPMILLSKEEIVRYAKLQDIYSVEGHCPFEKENTREAFRDIVKMLISKHKLARINLFNSMSNVNWEYLPGNN